MHLVDADGVIAGPFAVVEAFAESEGAFVESGSDGQGRLLKAVLVEAERSFVAILLRTRMLVASAIIVARCGIGQGEATRSNQAMK